MQNAVLNCSAATAFAESRARVTLGVTPAWKEAMLHQLQQHSLNWDLNAAPLS